MSDTTQPSAPPPSAPTTPQTAPAAPTQAEVPVNETPVSSPTPIGSQAPPKSPAVARQEALEKAFARAREAQDEATKTKRPGMGHNKPPEALAKEKAAPDKIAEKTERTSQPSEKQQRYREGGKFARDPAKAEQPPQPAGLPGQQQLPLEQQPAQQIKPLDERAPYREAPGRFRDQAKAEWHATPESVRAGVYQMAREFQGAYEKYKGSHEVMQEIQPYHDLATKQGTTLRKAFDNYYGMEQKLRQDPVGAVDIIIQNLSKSNGWKGPHGGPLNVHDFAQHVLSMTPEQHQLTQHRNSQTSTEMRIGQLHQQVEQQNQMLRQMVYEQKFAGSRAQVDTFADSHPRFDELADLIKSELDLGFTLEQAYIRADRLRPSGTQAAQTRTQTAQTRKTSISGAPDGGNRSANPRPSDGQRRNGVAKHPSIDDALARAMRRVGNGM